LKAARVAFAFVFLILLAEGCATLDIVKRPEVQAIRPRISGIDFQGVDLAFDVEVSNPYPVPIRTPAFRYGLDIEGTEFLSSKQSAKVDLPALRTGTVTLPVRLPYADLWRAFANLVDVPEARYTLHGAVLASALGQSFELPLKHSGTFPVLRPPTLSDAKVHVSDVSIRGARIVADAVIKNPNAFALGLKDVGYVLNVGDKQVGGLAASTPETVGPGETGRLTLSGTISAADVLSQLLKEGARPVKVLMSGSAQTPYGAVNLRP
jgi:LEA14-like dessication related protein